MSDQYELCFPVLHVQKMKITHWYSMLLINRIHFNNNVPGIINVQCVTRIYLINLLLMIDTR